MFQDTEKFFLLRAPRNQGSLTGRETQPGNFRPGEKLNLDLGTRNVTRNRPETQIFKFSTQKPARKNPALCRALPVTPLFARKNSPLLLQGPFPAK